MTGGRWPTPVRVVGQRSHPWHPAGRRSARRRPNPHSCGGARGIRYSITTPRRAAAMDV
jgi:hypothetical protein